MNKLSRYWNWLRHPRYMRAARYAAAQITNSTGDWMPLNQNINDLIRSSSPMVRARVKQLVRDMPHFARAVRVVVDLTVGSGMTFNSRVRTVDAALDTNANRKIEDFFKRWADEEADFYGRMSFGEMQRLVKRLDVEDGEFIVIKRMVKDRNRSIPFALQIMRSEQLSSYGTAALAGNRVDMGVEYDKEGRIVAYHFEDPDSWGKPFRVDAKYVIHGFEALQPLQLRGITPFAAGVMLARDLDDFLGSELDRNKLQSKFIAFIKTNNFRSHQAGLKKDEKERPLEDLENGIFQYLRDNEEVVLSNPSGAASSFDSYVKFQLQTFAINADISYEDISGNYKDVNYTTLRGISNATRRGFLPKQERHRVQFCNSIGREVIFQGALAGQIQLPGILSNISRYTNFYFAEPGMPSPDPYKEGRADIEAINNLLVSPQTVIRRRGDDPEVVLQEISEFYKQAAELGLSKEQISSALASNPQAIMDAAE